MDKNVVTATVLIALIMVVWMTVLAPEAPVDVPLDDRREDARSIPDDDVFQAPPEIPVPGAVPAIVEGDSTVAGTQEGVVRDITVETNMYTAVFSTRGGTLISLKLKEYAKFEEDAPVELVDSTKGGALSTVFTTPDNRVYDTRAFIFDTNFSSSRIEIDREPRDLEFSTQIGEGRITFRYTFQPDTYEIKLSVIHDNPDSFIARGGYELVWNGGLPFTEGNHQLETQQSGAFVRSGGEVENVVLNSDTYQEGSYRGTIDWIAVKNKYFIAAIIPDGETRGSELIGERRGELEDPDLRLDFVASLLIPLDGSVSDDFRLYLGPMEVSRIGRYKLHLYDTVDLGWDFFEVVTRPLAQYVFVPIFSVLASFLPNYGWVIIIFSILIKLLLYPLTKKSFQSMAKMKELQPRMEAIKEKYANDPKKQQQATMKMYKETGVNPLGGCLPMFLQYPIIITLWQFLPQAIALRQEGFMWATDLSAPDIILNLPFTIPMYGNFVAGFTLLMGLSMAVQMQFTPQAGSGAQAKIFMYVMPVFISVIFNKFASGLSLYYLCYNVLTAAQQKLIANQQKAKTDAASTETENNARRTGSEKRIRNKKSSKAKGRPASRNRR